MPASMIRLTASASLPILSENLISETDLHMSGGSVMLFRAGFGCGFCFMQRIIDLKSGRCKRFIWCFWCLTLGLLWAICQQEKETQPTPESEMTYQIDFSRGHSDLVAATVTVDDVPSGVTEDRLARHYENFARLFLRQVRDARVVAVRRA